MNGCPGCMHASCVSTFLGTLLGTFFGRHPLLWRSVSFAWLALAATSVYGGGLTCPAGTREVLLLSQDVEGAVDGWSSSTWGIVAGAGVGGSRAFGVENVQTARFATLNAPFIDLPADAQQITLDFTATRNLQGSDTDCFDGAVLETSDDGFNVLLIDPDLIQSDPYRGVIRSGGGNPYQNAAAWCGVQASFATATVDLTGFAGDPLLVSWTLASDNSVGTARSWVVDDIRIVACVTEELIFEDGFET